MLKATGNRNHRACQAQGYKVVEVWKSSESPAVRAMAEKYEDFLQRMDLLYNAAKVLVDK